MQADASSIAIKAKIFITWNRIEASRRALGMGLREQASELASMAQDLINETGETVALPDFHRLTGALALDSGDHQGAETSLMIA